MKVVVAALINLYSRLLLLYPPGFRDEFYGEMRVVFKDSVNEAARNGLPSLAMLCMRELVNLPVSVLWEFWNESKGMEIKMTATEQTPPSVTIQEKSGPRDALIATLPFTLFGIASMIGKLDLPFHGGYIYLVLYVIFLIGLLIGLISNVPRWTYSYLGWSMLLAWWWTGVRTPGMKILGYRMIDWDWQIWILFLTILVVVLISTRSLTPFTRLVKSVWQDWTLLSLAMYTVVAWLFLIYDENHSPYLIAFLIASTLAISVSVWVFMRSTNSLHRFIVLMSGFVANLVIDRISWSTWDFAAYYGLPPSPAMPWYDSILEVILITGFWGLILLLPAILGLVRHATNKHVV